MRIFAKLIFGFGILMILGVGFAATDQMSDGAIRASVAALASGERNDSPAASRKSLIAYLPEPQLGWKPQAWTPEIRSIMKMARIPPMPDNIQHGEPEDDLPFGVVNLASVSSMPNSVVYRRGSEIVIISIHKKRSGLQGAIIDRIEASSGERAPFARFGPATYVEMLDFLGEQDDPYREFFARLGGKVDISVQTRARDSSIKSLLAKIDHAGIVRDYGLEIERSKPITGTLPQVSTSTYDDPLGDAYDQELMVDAMVSENWILRLSRWLNSSSKPKKEQGGVVVRRGGSEGCETNRGGCPMSTMSFP